MAESLMIYGWALLATFTVFLVVIILKERTRNRRHDCNAFLLFSKIHNVHRTENKEQCCGNCRSFIFEQRFTKSKFVYMPKPDGEIQFGICQLALQEKSPIVKTTSDYVCDVYTIREGVDMEETKTLEEWAKLDGITILDPDGFDRTDLDLWERKFTKAQYDKGICNCTISMDREKMPC